MKHFIATISFDVDDDANVNNIVDIASDRMQECEGNVHIYDTHVEENDTANSEAVSTKTDTQTPQLTESDWRMIHNALCGYQLSYHCTTPLDRQRIQQIMDKVRDNHIAPTASKASMKTTTEFKPQSNEEPY